VLPKAVCSKLARTVGEIRWVALFSERKDQVRRIAAAATQGDVDMVPGALPNARHKSEQRQPRKCPPADVGS
jgi:hypothetical protein